MIRVGVIGLGKMGISHLAMFRAHPDVVIAAVCDASGYVLEVLGKYTGVRAFTDVELMLATAELDAVVIATPSHLHGDMIRRALNANLAVFCEKPFCIDVREGRELASLAARRGLVTQVGYHNRYVASFAEVHKLLAAGAIGEVTHVLAEAYGPVVLKPSGTSWRSRRSSGGGCLYDYAAHPIDLLTWYFGPADTAAGSVLQKVFSTETEDEVYTTLKFGSRVTAQVSVSWSDESQRKMSTQLTFWGTKGRIHVDRQEVQAYLRNDAQPPEGYRPGWNVRYTTDLTQPVWFYLRGEEYSAQVADFVRRVHDRADSGVNTFESALVTDECLALIIQDSAAEHAWTPASLAMAGAIGLDEGPPRVVPPKSARERWRSRWGSRPQLRGSR
ncbi:putative dehydrogenase [Phycicoccus badiiscoriae]|uniref:Putative dehydrogenase n=1 Tax=Pedococcus badiiscoriae TaxID=642776 RepID=A0A852WDM7_9MICO|nr:Gfo/Idh/MocA family oxidoreductase [Pedococcus badiiscoriae]NYG07377.1 putative dehydrogenase [Pedococcus badiiscoriae]